MLAEPPESPEFIMTVNSNRRQLEPLVEDGDILVMRNVMQFRNTDSLRVSKPYAGRYVLDSGGYTAMDEFGGEFPWTVSEYHEWARKMYAEHPFEWVAVMDLACEPAFDDEISVAERIDRTVENTVALLDHDPSYPVLPVLQGREINQWLTCYDKLRDYGIDPDYAGIGTLCRQTSGNRIKEIVRAIRARTNIDAFHGFGVKSTAFKAGARFETADSQAWSWPIKYGIMLELAEESPTRLRRVDVNDCDADVHRRTFEAYYKHTSRLQREAYPTDDRVQASLFDMSFRGPPPCQRPDCTDNAVAETGYTYCTAHRETELAEIES